MRRLSTLAFTGALVAATLALVTGVSPTLASSPNVAPWVQVDDSPTGCTNTCADAPPLGAGAAMAYDAASHQMVLFGPDYGNDTWLWSGSAWTQTDDATDLGCTSTCTDSPPDRNVFAMTYDAASGSIIIFGGNELNDTWAWHGSTWTQVADGTDPGCTDSCPSSPPSNTGGRMAYDPTTKQVILFGGGNDYEWDYNDTWALTWHGGSTYTWAQVDDSTDPRCTIGCIDSPPDRNVNTFAFDPATNQLVLFGGELTGGRANGLNDTWIWTGSAWQQVDDNNGKAAGCGESSPTSDPCPASPQPRIGAGMAFDPALGELVLFGGMNNFNDEEYNDTWAWNGTTWSHIDNAGDASCTDTCAASPYKNDTFAFADDGSSNQLVLFGGTYGGNATWIIHAVPAAPSAPTHVKAVTHGTSVTVSWSAPTDLGASAITRYQVKSSPGRETCVISTATTCTISGYNPALKYTVSVTATNSVGTGPSASVKNVKG